MPDATPHEYEADRQREHAERDESHARRLGPGRDDERDRGLDAAGDAYQHAAFEYEAAARVRLANGENEAAELDYTRAAECWVAAARAWSDLGGFLLAEAWAYVNAGADYGHVAEINEGDEEPCEASEARRDAARAFARAAASARDMADILRHRAGVLERMARHSSDPTEVTRLQQLARDCLEQARHDSDYAADASRAAAEEDAKAAADDAECAREVR